MTHTMFCFGRMFPHLTSSTKSKTSSKLVSSCKSGRVHDLLERAGNQETALYFSFAEIVDNRRCALIVIPLDAQSGAIKTSWDIMTLCAAWFLHAISDNMKQINAGGC